MPYCDQCGYDLRERTVGARCPECGRDIKRTIARPLPRPAPAILALTVVLGLPLTLTLPVREPMFITLVASIGCCAILFVMAFVQRGTGDHLHRLALVLSVLAAAMPLAVLCLFTLVFVIGRSSNVAQLAGDSGFDYGRLWLDVWPMLSLATPISGLCALVALVIPPYRPRFVVSLALPLCCLVAFGSALLLVGMHMPYG